MLYRYKLLLVMAFGLMLLTLGYLYDIYPRLAHIASLKQTENNINDQWISMKRLPSTSQLKKTINVASDKNVLNKLSDLTRLIRASGLMIQSMALSPVNQDKLSKQFLLRAVLIGDYQQLSLFIHELDRQAHSIALHDFSCKWTEKNDLLVTMVVFYFDHFENKKFINRDTVFTQFNPFCLSSSVDKWINDNLNEAVLAPLEQIKMVGYLQSGKHKQALVLLPNSVIRTVEPGFLLGSEKGKVVDINKKQIMVKLPDEHIIKIKFKESQLLKQ